MAAPTDSARPTSAGTSTGGSPFNINQPTVVSGDIMICICMINGTILGTTPVGFTNIYGPASVDGTILYGTVGYRICDGSEGATTTATSNVASKYTCIVWRCTGVDTSVTPIISTKASATSTTTDPTSATGANKDWLWLFVGATNNQPTMPPTGPPSGYGNTVGIQSGGAGGASSKTTCFGASKQALATTTEDPGSWTIDVSSTWGAWTVGVAGPVTPPSATWNSGMVQHPPEWLLRRRPPQSWFGGGNDFGAVTTPPPPSFVDYPYTHGGFFPH